MPQTLPQNADDQAHFAYYDKAHDVSFVWAGNPDECIEVCPGGYAEPVQDTIHPRSHNVSFVSSDPAGWLDWFESVCGTYIARRYGE